MSPLSRRLLLGASLAAPFIRQASTQAARAQIARGEELTVGVWGGEQERILREFCVAPLEEKYGARISLVLGGTVERRARAYAERGRPSFDVLYLNIFESRQAVKDGVTQAPTDAVPNAAHLFPAARLGGYGVAFNPVTIVYDKRAVSAPITSWRDLWRPELRGKLIWPTYPGAQGTAALLMSAKAWGGSEADIEPAFRKIAELKPFAAFQSSQDQLFTLFDQGVGAASIEFGSFTRSYAEARNPNIVIADPAEGQALAANVACITTGTKSQRLAEEWVNLHPSPACQRAYAERILYSPSVRNADLPDGLAAKVTIGDAVGRLVDFDWDVVTRNQPRWSSRFTREIAG